MSTTTTSLESLGRFGPNLVTVPFQAVIFGFYGKLFLPIGPAGILIGALVGVLWAWLLGFVATRLSRREAWRAWLANAPLFLGIVAIGLMSGAGYMYGAMMGAALGESSLTYAVLSALMQPAVPFFILFNSAMELLLISLIVYGNWNAAPRRRTLILVGVLVYLVLRIWTYLVFAEGRLQTSQQTLSETDVAWFSQTLATDFRIVLDWIVFICFLLAAFIPARLTQSGLAGVAGEQPVTDLAC